MRYALVLMIVLAMACGGPPPSREQQAAAAATVGILFSVDGITVYRFYDVGSRPHYFAVRDGRPDTVTLSQYRCGKSCVDTDVLQVLAR